MAQVIEDAHEEHEVERLVELDEIVDLHAPELEPLAHAELLRRPARLAQVVLIDVDREHVGAAPHELERIEARVAADVERAPAVQVRRQNAPERAPHRRREVAERVLGRRLRPVRQVQVVEPRPEARDLRARVVRRRASAHRAPPAAATRRRLAATSSMYRSSSSTR